MAENAAPSEVETAVASVVDSEEVAATAVAAAVREDAAADAEAVPPRRRNGLR